MSERQLLVVVILGVVTITLSIMSLIGSFTDSPGYKVTIVPSDPVTVTAAP